MQLNEMNLNDKLRLISLIPTALKLMMYVMVTVMRVMDQLSDRSRVTVISTVLYVL